MYHQPQSSPGSKDWIIGWFVAWKCLVACLFFESLQQPTCPHSRQRRRCTHVSPILKQSSQPFALGVTCRIWSRWVHCVARIVSFPMFSETNLFLCKLLWQKIYVGPRTR